MPWLFRFLLAGATVPRVQATAEALAPLLRDAPTSHSGLATESGVPELIRQDGLLYAYPDRRAFEAEALAWRLRRDNGVRWTELSAEELRACEPALDPRYRFGAIVEAGAHCSDPGAYVVALVRCAATEGSVLVRSRVIGFDLAGAFARGPDRSRQPRLRPRGDRRRRLVEAACKCGRRPRQPRERARLSRRHRGAGDRLAHPRHASDGKMANTMTSSGLRVSGQVELAGIEAPPNWKRAQVSLDHLRQTYPAQPKDIPAERLSIWLGHRPSTHCC